MCLSYMPVSLQSAIIKPFCLEISLFLHNIPSFMLDCYSFYMTNLSDLFCY